MKEKLSALLVSEMLTSHNINKGSRIIIALSGGSDSICLVHMLKQSGYNIITAHCNFKLRGTESDADEQFVIDFCNKINIPVKVNSFNTSEYAEERKISIQEAARELRYNWFEALRKENGFDFIATAHHSDDNIETVLHHIIRGCGIEGLQGMKLQNDRIIRPLLSFSKQQIIDYIHEQHLSYRDDSSNTKTDYTRNFIRKEIIPLLNQVNPSFAETFQRNMVHWKDAFNIYNNYILKTKNKLLEHKSGDIRISIGKLLQTPAPSTFLFECIKDYGFNESQNLDLLKSFVEQSGKEFYSISHRIIKDRKYIIITPLQNESVTHLINKDTKTLKTRYHKISFELIPNSSSINLDNNKYQYLDNDKLSYPLLLRPWKQGDYFYPAGLNKKKKMSNYFTDKKLSIPDKEIIPIIFSSEKVATVLTERIDERFKVTVSTKNVLKILAVKL